jgi:hypothetical protein
MNKRGGILGELAKNFVKGLEAVSSESKKAVRETKKAFAEVKIEPRRKETDKAAKQEKKESKVRKIRKVKVIDDKFKEILKNVQKFEPMPVANEDELQNQLYQRLSVSYPKIKKARKKEESPDIIINGKYALEVKIAKNQAALTYLTGELIRYSKHYPNIAAIILNAGKVPESLLKEYASVYASNANVQTIFINGVWKGKKSRNIKINVRQS